MSLLKSNIPMMPFQVQRPTNREMSRENLLNLVKLSHLFAFQALLNVKDISKFSNGLLYSQNETNSFI